MNKAALSGTRLRLTDGGGAQARSAFVSTAMNVQAFTSDFTFQLTSPSADGFAFVIQNNLPTAVGSAGSGLGYQGIGKSVAVKFDLYNSAGEGTNSTGLYVNGAAPTMPATALTGVDLHSGHVLAAHLVYAGTTLSMTLTDPSTGATFSKSFTIDIPGTVGATSAFVGFSGGTGGLTATQEIVTWSFGPSSTTTAPPVTTPPVTTPPVTTPAPATGSWVNVTPSGMNMDPNFGSPNSNFGVDSVVVDPVRPSDLYASADYQGVWKSTDYGQTWKKVSTGTNGTFFDSGRPWFLGIDSNKSRNPATAPAIWTASGYGKQFGLYKSTDGGVNWGHTNFPAFTDGITNGQDPSSIDVDPYDGTHLVMGFHGTTEFAESTDGGTTWKVIPMPAGVGTSMAVFFIDTGAAASTRTNWLAVSQWGNNTQGTWHTSNGGAAWARVGTFEHFHGSTQVFNAGNKVAYLSATGGVYKTTDGGATWTNINGGNGNGVVGTPSNLYTSFGWSTNGTWDPQMATASRGNDAKWTAVATPAGMLNGDKHGAVTFDGTHYVLVTSNGNGGIWRFVEGGTTTVTPPPVVTPPAITISISPATATIAASGTQQFSATVTGSTDTAVIWSLLETAGCGAISASGLYTAPAAAATCHAVATSHASSAKTASATITVSPPVVVTPPPAVTIKVSPVSATVVAGKTQAFTCTVTGSTNTACTWSASSGSISAAGLFTAPATAGVLVVVAKSAADATKTASAAVTVTASTTTTPPPVTPPATGHPSLQVVNGALLDPHGNKIILRGLNSQGMGMVYGDKANPGTYVPMTPLQYVNRAVQTDATGNKWYATAIRLNFERFPCTDPTRLYTVENTPYAMPDTIAFNAWTANTAVSEGQVATFGGKRYRAMKRTWRADRGASWNPGTYAAGDIVSGYGNGNDLHLYRAVTGGGVGPSSNWGGGPSGVSTTVPVTDAMGNTWLYAGEFGTTGTAQPFSTTAITDYSVGTAFADHFVWWQFMSADYTPAQALANFNDWKAKVMDPAIQAAVNAGLYVVV
ncbi:MAG TPA: hypothetical protein VH083_19190, partial [Myxococcales bacterium]|nr:hypothetical protein [Myxococcales bacterium]